MAKGAGGVKAEGQKWAAPTFHLCVDPTGISSTCIFVGGGMTGGIGNNC